MEHKHTLMGTASFEGEGVGACTESVMDRFSNLPKEFAHLILSFINIKNLTRFSCVLKRCRELSPSPRSLNFCGFSSAETATCELSFPRQLSALVFLGKHRASVRMRIFEWSRGFKMV